MKTQLKTISNEKSKGRFYTPSPLVVDILDMANYGGEAIIKKHAIDNSCGDGAFLIQMVSRYCKSAVLHGLSAEEIKSDLGIFIHGIEIDEAECAKCISNLTAVAKSHNIRDVKWDIRCKDAMDVHDYDGKMDYVFGNPPYVRVHNAGEAISKIKKYSFADAGMTDYYLAFFEVGLNMLNSNGKLGYVTSNSYFCSIAGRRLREHLIKNNLIEKIVDMKHFQAFSATTYTAIAIINKNKTNNNVSYCDFDNYSVVDMLTPEDFYIDGKFFFAKKSDLSLLKKIFGNKEHCSIKAKNGYATLCDDVFIGNIYFYSDHVIPVIKASTGKMFDMIYPYDKEARLIPESELKKDSDLYKYLLNQRSRLEKRSLEKKELWYSFGRSQALKDTYKDKLTLNSLLRTTSDLKMIEAPSGVGVYGGLYLVGDEREKAKNVILSDDFVNYVKMLGKYKSGGYYTFSSKDVNAYLDYKLTQGE